MFYVLLKKNQENNLYIFQKKIKTSILKKKSFEGLKPVFHCSFSCHEGIRLLINFLK